MTLRIPQISLPVLIGLLGFLVFLPLNVREGDTYWHIKAGEWIFIHRQIPLYDVFSYTREGAPWVSSEWLAELIIYGFYSLGGWGGLHVLASLAVAITVASIARVQLSRQGSPYLIIVSALMAYGLCYTHFWARPHLLAWVPLVWWAAWQADAGEKGTPPPWWTILLMVLWANLHGSFTVGLVLAALGAVEAIEGAWRRGEPMIALKPWAAYAAYAAYLAAVFVVTMATPYGMDGILFTQQTLGMEKSMEFIAEWRSPNFHSLHPFEVWLLLVIAAVSLKHLNVSWARWLLLFLLIDTSLRYQRNAVLFGLLIPIYFGKAVDTTWIAAHGSAVNRVLNRWPRRTSAMAWCLVATIAIGTALMPLTVTDASSAKRFYASDAIQAVREWSGGREPGPVFNDYGLGGYLIFEGIKPFIDGRNVVYGDDFLGRYAEAEGLTSSSALTSILADYGIRWTLLNANSPAVALLDHLDGWRRIYADDQHVVHVRDKPPSSLRVSEPKD